MQAGAVTAHRLPTPRTSFVGRDRELRDIEVLLAAGHMVTLTGPGGSGKTRLALEAARRLAELFPDGPVLVELAGLASRDLVAAVVASSLGVRGRAEVELAEEIAEAIGDRRPLLLLDNCEHLVEACAALADTLIARCARLGLIATSRTPLRISGERVLAVPPLDIDGEALALFADRARAVNAGFAVDHANRADVSAICRRLDGIPLAIELAASWSAVMTPSELLPLLDRRFEVLRGGPRGAAERQRTLWAAVDWSHELLGAQERILFRRLAAFAGSFSREAAEHVCADEALPPGVILGTLAALCGASMVVARTPATGMTRYRLLETLRAYGLERLREAGEDNACRRGLLASLTALAENAYEERMRGGPQSVVGVLEEDRDNVRAALDWGLANDPATALGLAGTLVEDVRRSLFGFREMRQILDALLALAPARSPRRARALLAAGYMAMVAADDGEARGRFAESCQLFDELGDRGGEAWAHLALGTGAWLSNDSPTALGELALAEALHAELGNRFGCCRTRLRRAMTKVFAPGLGAEGRSELEAVVAEGHLLGDPFSEGLAMAWLGLLDLSVGRREAAESRFAHSFRVLMAGGDPVMALPISGIGACSAAVDPARALRILGAAETFWRQAGLRKPPAIQRMLEGASTRAIALIGEEEGAQAFAAGLALSFDDAAALALSDPETSGRPGRPAARAGGLTDREAQIAALVADGLTNRQIADSLVLSVRTVETHVDRILTKLGFHGRARIASWVREQEPGQTGAWVKDT